MAAIWSGHITFGLVSLPVQLHSVVREARPRLHEVHAGCGARVRHRRVCEREERELQAWEISRGWEAPDGRMVELAEEDLERLPLPSRRVIEVLGFVPDREVDPLMYARPYYCAPHGQAADRPYVLLVEALAGAGQVAVCKLAVRTRERLAVLRPRRGLLICHTLLWPDEIREPGDWAPPTPVTDRELELAETLMRQLTGVEVAELHDEYGAALEQLVDARATGQAVCGVPEPEPAEDLMAALEESIRRTRGSSTR